MQPEGDNCLVKGMTRRIIEIKQTGNVYFEKAVFYCRTNIPRGTTDDTLTKEASRIIDRLCSEGIGPSGRGSFFHGRSRLFSVLNMLACAAAGALAAFVFLRWL